MAHTQVDQQVHLTPTPPALSSTSPTPNLSPVSNTIVAHTQVDQYVHHAASTTPLVLEPVENSPDITSVPSTIQRHPMITRERDGTRSHPPKTQWTMH